MCNIFASKSKCFLYLTPGILKNVWIVREIIFQFSGVLCCGVLRKCSTINILKCLLGAAGESVPMAPLLHSRLACVQLLTLLPPCDQTHGSGTSVG